MHIIDRRRNPHGKSHENRQRFLRRAKALVQEAVRRSTEDRDIRDILRGGDVTIPVGSIEEPRLARGAEGTKNLVIPGNKTFVEGDILPRPDGGGQGRGSGPDAGGDSDAEDTFRFVLTREEFLNLFLDDLELPDLAKRQLAETELESPVRAGYSVTGSPANISIARSMRHAMMRKVALHRPRASTIEALSAEIAACDDEEERQALQEKLDALLARKNRIPFVDPIDLRYRRFEIEKKPIVQAVMFCLMDVSGSMSEHMKDLAKRFYMLLYIFLTRRYKRVDIVFIRHTDRAEEVDEQTFFYSPATGGTKVSSALETMQRILEERYDPSAWNIYAAQASDGDNGYDDGPRTEHILRSAILPVTQYFAYLEVGDPGDRRSSASALWSLYEGIRADTPFLSARKVTTRGEIFPVFRELFRKQVQGERVSP
jgi:uncharacterized sporulation protein YeaH/YhbH (DUF444 family)